MRRALTLIPVLLLPLAACTQSQPNEALTV